MIIIILFCYRKDGGLQGTYMSYLKLGMTILCSARRLWKSYYLVSGTIIMTTLFMDLLWRDTYTTDCILDVYKNNFVRQKLHSFCYKRVLFTLDCDSLSPFNCGQWVRVSFSSRFKNQEGLLTNVHHLHSCPYWFVSLTSNSHDYIPD